MEFLKLALALVGHSMSMLQYYWPVTLGLTIAVAVTSIANFPFVPGRFRPRHLFIFLPLVIAFAIVAWGAAYNHTDRATAAPEWPLRVVNGLVISQALVSIGVVSVMKGYRWFSLCAVLLQMWVGLAFAFVASMAVTNDWL